MQVVFFFIASQHCIIPFAVDYFIIHRWGLEGKTSLCLVLRKSPLQSCRKKGLSEKYVPWMSMSAWHLQVI